MALLFLFIPLLIPWFELKPWEIPFPVIHTLKLQPFGLLVAIGILLGSRVAEWRGEKTGRPALHAVADFLVYTTVIGLIALLLPERAVLQTGRPGRDPEGPDTALEKVPRACRRSAGSSAASAPRSGSGTRSSMSLLVLGDIWCFAFPFAWVFCRIGCFTRPRSPGRGQPFLPGCRQLQRARPPASRPRPVRSAVEPVRDRRLFLSWCASRASAASSWRCCR